MSFNILFIKMVILYSITEANKRKKNMFYSPNSSNFEYTLMFHSIAWLIQWRFQPSSLPNSKSFRLRPHLLGALSFPDEPPALRHSYITWSSFCCLCLTQKACLLSIESFLFFLSVFGNSGLLSYQVSIFFYRISLWSSFMWKKYVQE